jgi:hypothetical protein
MSCVVRAAVLVCCADACLAGLVITDLGADFRPRAIDNQGRITGQLISTQKAVIWDGNDFVEIGTLGGPTSIGNAIYNGQVVGTSDNIFGSKSAFRYNGSLTELTTPFVVANTTGIDVNAAGQKLGNVNVSGTKLVALWNASNTFSTALNSLSATAFGINDSGDGVAVRDGFNTGIYWAGTKPSMPAKTFTTFVPSGGINNQRLLAGVLGNTTAAVYLVDVSEAPEPIPNIGALGTTSAVSGLNNSNELVGNTNATVFHYDFDTGRLTDLNAQQFTGAAFDSLVDVRAINDNGLFIGTGLVGGVEHAFVAELTLRLLGDYDGNSMVEQADYDKWKMDFGMTVSPDTGSDGNSNGIVDAADFTVWRDHLGDGFGSGAAAIEPTVAVPEPPAAMVVLGGLIYGLAIRHHAITRHDPSQSSSRKPGIF